MKWLILMAGVVCNLLFNTPSCFAVNASAPGQPDGSIFVSALDGTSMATVRYSIGSDFIYPFGQASGSFTNLVPGTYTVYARNSTSCRATIQLTVGVASAYAIRYRLEFHDLKSFPLLGSNRKWRLDIEDKEYSAAVSELEGAGEDPVTISWRGEGSEDIFGTNVISSELSVNINSRTDQEYIDFYTFDERRFRAKLYEYVGGYQLRFQGFLTPMLYSEPYVSKRNYDVNLVFTDGLADLKDYDFGDDSGNIIYDRIPVFNALNYIINKTDIQLNIWETVNLYATGQLFGTNDSTLEQTYLNPRGYINKDGTVKNCREVLGYIMDFLGAKIYQSNGRWNIDLISEKTASEVATRKRTSNYGVISGGLEEPRYMLRVAGAPSPKVTFSEQSGVMNIPQTYGTVKLIYNLGLEEPNNLLDYGNFQDEDIANGQLKGYEVDLTNGANVSLGLEEFETDKYALFIDFDVTQLTESVTLRANPIAYIWPGQPHRIRLTFDVYTRPLFTDVWIAFDYALKLTNSGVPITYLLQPDLFGSLSTRYMDTPTTNLQAGEYNRVYITEHLTWKTISADIYIFQSSFEGALELYMQFRSNPSYDFASITLLKALATTTDKVRLYSNKARVLLPQGGAGNADDDILFYELDRGTELESSPEIIRPDDYDGTTNPYVWRLKKRTAYPTTDNGANLANSLLQSILVRNVRMEYLPLGEPAQETIEIIEVPNTNVKQVLEKNTYHGDLDLVNTDENYEYISNAWLSFSDGSPITGGWQRRGVTENYGIQQLLGKMIRGQYQDIRWKLSGTLHCPDGVPTFWNTLHEVRTGKVYQFMALTLMLRTMQAEFEAIETLAGGDPLDEGADPGGTPGEIEPPVSTRVHTVAFATAFN